MWDLIVSVPDHFLSFYFVLIKINVYCLENLLLLKVLCIFRESCLACNNIPRALRTEG